MLIIWPSPVVLSYGSATPPATVPLLPEEVVHLTVGLFLSVPLVLHLLETPFLAPHPVVRLSNSHSQRLGSGRRGSGRRFSLWVFIEVGGHQSSVTSCCPRLPPSRLAWRVLRAAGGRGLCVLGGGACASLAGGDSELSWRRCVPGSAAASELRGALQPFMTVRAGSRDGSRDRGRGLGNGVGGGTQWTGTLGNLTNDHSQRAVTAPNLVTDFYVP